MEPPALSWKSYIKSKVLTIYSFVLQESQYEVLIHIYGIVLSLCGWQLFAAFMLTSLQTKQFRSILQILPQGIYNKTMHSNWCHCFDRSFEFKTLQNISKNAARWWSSHGKEKKKHSNNKETNKYFCVEYRLENRWHSKNSNVFLKLLTLIVRETQLQE